MNSFCNAFYQTLLYLFPVLAASENFNNQINHIAGFDQTFLDFTFLLFSFQKSGVFSGGDLENKVHMIFNNLFQA